MSRFLGHSLTSWSQIRVSIVQCFDSGGGPNNNEEMVKRGTRGPLQKAKGCGLIANLLGGMHGLNLSSG